MQVGDKDTYKCFQCEERIVVGMVDKGTIPTFVDCLSTSCDGKMHREYSPSNAIGRTPTHELRRDPEAVTDKLRIIKVEEEV